MGEPVVLLHAGPVKFHVFRGSPAEMGMAQGFLDPDFLRSRLDEWLKWPHDFDHPYFRKNMAFMRREFPDSMERMEAYGAAAGIDNFDHTCYLHTVNTGRDEDACSAFGILTAGRRTRLLTIRSGAVVLNIPRDKDEKVTAADLGLALGELGEKIHPGDAILVATGYNRFGSSDVRCELTPHFSYDAIDWAVSRKPSILASDMASWHDGEEEPSFWPMLMRSGVLVIGSLMNVSTITVHRIRLIALPMKIRGACAAPCRLIAVLPSCGGRAG